MKEIRDLVYLDFDKAASIWSQFEGGLRERVSINNDDGKGQKAGVTFGIPKVAEANLGADYSQKRSTLETKILHHDILDRVDKELTESGLVCDVSKSITSSEVSSEYIRETIGDSPYVKATGSCVIENYPRILSICERFNHLVEFISKGGVETIKKSPEFIELQEQINQSNIALKSIKDRNEKKIAQIKLDALKSASTNLCRTDINNIDDWLINGIKLWIETFMENRVNFRTYPFAQCPSFQVLCNLKRDCIVDQDPEHLFYGYGNRPNVKLTVFGLITSSPALNASEFDPMSEFETNKPLNDKVAFEQAFRKLFMAMDDIEAFSRYSRYPNITIHPIAIYRSFAANLP